MKTNKEKKKSLKLKYEAILVSFFALIAIFVLINMFGKVKDRELFEDSSGILIETHPYGKLDTASVQGEFVSVSANKGVLQIRKILDYYRYEDANYSQLGHSSLIDVTIIEENDKDLSRIDISSNAVEIDKLYTINLELCFNDYYDGLKCAVDGWSAIVYPYVNLSRR